ncbi:MAG: hypothetical protein Q9168_007526 [Polycauliona sp. 1 TL-2023]
MSLPIKGKGMTWTDAAQNDLMKCVFHLHVPKSIKYPELETAMRALGYDCTAKAITHRIQKIRSEAAAATPAATTTTPGATIPMPATPSKTRGPGSKNSRAVPAKTTKAATGGAKAKTHKRKVDDMDEEGESEASASAYEKKLKIEQEDEEQDFHEV